jgi:hypothetical protein
MNARNPHLQRRDHRAWYGPAQLFSLLLMLGIVAVALPDRTRAQDAPASLTIDVYTCESRNDPIDPTESLIDQCTLGTDDIVFTLDAIGAEATGASASTGTGGAPSTISFTDLTPGDYRLTQQTPDTIGLSYILQCTSSTRTFDYPFTPFAIIEPGGRLNIELQPGDQLACDWYNVQATPDEPADTATLTITAYSCSGDVIGPGMCDLAPNVTFTIVDAAGNAEQFTTGADGIATFDGAGAYQISPTSELPDRNFCAFEPYGTISISDGSVTLDPANPIAMDAYYCYPGA